jgi:putative transposase
MWPCACVGPVFASSRGWALRGSLSRELAVAALQRALKTGDPKPGLSTTPIEAANTRAPSTGNSSLLTAYLRQSMSGAGCCFDKAVAESFIASLKKERSNRGVFAMRTEANDAMAEYIGFHNTRRVLSANGFERRSITSELDKSTRAA